MEPEVPAVESEAAPVSETASPWARPPPDCRASMQPRLPQGQGMGPPGRPASHSAGGSRKGRGSQFQPALHLVSPIPMGNRFIATRGRNRKDQFQSEPPVLRKATASQGPGLSCPVFWASAFTSWLGALGNALLEWVCSRSLRPLPARPPAFLLIRNQRGLVVCFDKVPTFFFNCIYLHFI